MRLRQLRNSVPIFTLYICPHFLGDFHHFHVITTVLHQWPLCQVFDVGCAVSSLLRRPFQQELCQLVFLWRAEGSCSHAPYGRTCDKTLCPSMFCKSKALRQLHEYQKELSAFLWGLLVTASNWQDFRKKLLQLLPYLSNTYKVKVVWTTENVNKLMVHCYCKMRHCYSKIFIQ